MRLTLIVLTALLITSAVADARGRYGSHRVGGVNSHGRWSHYTGGR